MFKVAIIGGDKTKDYNFFKHKCCYLLQKKSETDTIFIYSLGDEFVDRFGKEFNIDVQIMEQIFSKYKKNLDEMKNDDIFDELDALIVFKTIRGAEYIYNAAKERNIPARLIKKINAV